MKKFTIKGFCANTNIPARLVKAVIRQAGDTPCFIETAPDVANYGAAGGFLGFVYYAETVNFTRRNLALILDYCKQSADDMGYDGVVSFVTSFACLKDLTTDDVAEALYSKPSNNRIQVFNALAWFMLEETSRAYVDYMQE